MFGDRHLQQYFVEDHIYAVVVRSLHLHSSYDHVCEDMIQTICCDYSLLCVCVCVTSSLLSLYY